MRKSLLMSLIVALPVISFAAPTYYCEVKGPGIYSRVVSNLVFGELGNGYISEGFVYRYESCVDAPQLVPAACGDSNEISPRISVRSDDTRTAEGPFDFSVYLFPSRSTYKYEAEHRECAADRDCVLNRAIRLIDGIYPLSTGAAPSSSELTYGYVKDGQFVKTTITLTCGLETGSN